MEMVLLIIRESLLGRAIPVLTKLIIRTDADTTIVSLPKDSLF